MDCISPPLPLEPAGLPENHYSINAHCWFVDSDRYRIVFCRGIDMYRISLDSPVELRYAAVSLRQGGHATQKEIAEAFGHTVRTQIRWERRFAERGLQGLLDQDRSGRPSALSPSQVETVKAWFGRGLGNREMARRLGVSEKLVRRLLSRLGLRRPPKPSTPAMFEVPDAVPTPPPPVVPTGEADGIGVPAVVATEPPAPVLAGLAAGLPAPATDGGPVPTPPAPDVPQTSDLDPLCRTVDRMLARQGLLDDAAPFFADGDKVSRGGVLLALPLFVASGVLRVFETLYRSLGPAFYGLRTTVVCLFLLALIRIRRPESLKEHDPCDLGRIMGLDRMPEVKTLRRKLATLAGRGKGMELMRGLAELRLRTDGERIGFLYVDGHVREYHGQYAIGKAHITQKRLSAPATTDTWVHDAGGDPLFVVTSELNAGLTRALPEILGEMKTLAGPGRRLTVVFDRGGFSPALFATLQKDFDLITYRKGKMTPIHRRLFVPCAVLRDSREETWYIHDRPKVPVGKRKVRGEEVPWLTMRQVTRLRKDRKGQTQVLTTRKDLPALEVLQRMFSRWRQENWFKYMKEEFALDALCEYGQEELTPEADRPNPERRELEKERDVARDRLESLMAELGKALEDNDESRRPTVRGFKIARSNLRGKIAAARGEIESLTKRIAALPARVSAKDLRRLKHERRLVVDAVKMVAYQMETQLLDRLSAHYPRVRDEGRTLLHAAFGSPARLEVSDRVLRVTIAPQSAPHRSQALRKLCDDLNRTGANFPGSALRLELAVEGGGA